MYKKRTIALLLLVLSVVTSGPLSFAEKAQPRESIRLFINTGQDKTYLMGFHWINLNINQKIAMVETARRGALQMDAVITLPAEIYVRELDRMFEENPSLRQIEVGQAIQGIAISFKDWNTGQSTKGTP